MSAIGRLLRFAEIEMQPFDVSRNPSLPANRDRIPKASFHAKTYVFDRASRCVCPWTWRCIAAGVVGAHADEFKRRKLAVRDVLQRAMAPPKKSPN